MSQGYKWKPIEDLPGDWQTLASSELAGLFAVWKEHVVGLKDSPAYQEFQVRLRREWAIETGIIEGLYDIDRGVTRTLIERGLHASLIAHGDANKPAEEIIPMLKDHESVVEGLFDFVGQKRQLSTSYIKQIHQALTTHQETATGIDELGRRTQVSLLRGDWKKWPNNPTRTDGLIHEYCPPEQTASEMDRLIELHQQHTRQEVPPEIEAAWLHHRFTQIHPFQDGNGRVARALASLVLIRAGWFPFVIDRDERTEYISCLEKADAGNISLLVKLFSKIQKKTFNKAINISRHLLLPADSIEQVISMGVDQLRSQKANEVLLAPQLRSVVLKLQDFAKQRLEAVANKLDEQLKLIDPDYAAYSNRFHESSGETAYSSLVIEIANKLGYQADIKTYNYINSLEIDNNGEKRWVRIVFSFHAAGEVTPRLLAVSAFFTDLHTSPLPISQEVFLCSAQEEETSIVLRFEQWLEEALLIGLEQWRKQL